MNVLSLFDGMSCGQIALRELGIIPSIYYASEIDTHAIKQTQLNFPETIQLGSVVDVDISTLEPIDLLIGGSPCQSFSFAGKRKGMTTSRNEEIYTLDRYMELKRDGFEFEGQSYLFWEYMRILRDAKPKYFLLENVVMGDKWENILSDAIGIRAVQINSALVSAQNRKRLYWVGQIRERMYFSENYCYECSIKKYNKNENGGIQEKTQAERIREVLERTQNGHFDLQGMRKRIFKNEQEGNNENLLGRVSGNQQERKRQEQKSGEKICVHQEILQRKQDRDEKVSGRIQEDGCRERSNEKSGHEKGRAEKREVCYDERVEFTEKQEDCRNNKYIDAKTDMCCVWCGKELDHRPRLSFVEGWEKYEGKSPSSLSKMQFDEIKQNNGRIYDFIPVGVKGIDTLFGETLNPIPQPEDKGILLRDILEENVEEKYFLSEKMIKTLTTDKDLGNGVWKGIECKSRNEKSSTLTSRLHKMGKSDTYIKLDKQLKQKFDQQKASCFTAGGNSGGNHSDMDLICVAMRGRNPDNPSDRTTGAPTEQRLEPKMDGKTNCLTSVTKDNLVMQLNQSKENNFKRGDEKANSFLSTSWKGSQSNGMTLINSLNKYNEKGENKRRSCEILLALRDEINSRKNGEWEMAIYARFFTDEVLFSRMYEKFISESKIRPEDNKEWEKSSSKNVTNGNMLNMQLGNWDRCSSQGQKSIKQFIRQLAACMSELSQQDTSSKESMHYLWKTSKRIWILRKALSEIQKIWESICCETESIQHGSRIRRLTPYECSKLQTVPEWYKWECSDTQQYKMLGNGWTIEVIKHILSHMK